MTRININSVLYKKAKVCMVEHQKEYEMGDATKNEIPDIIEANANNDKEHNTPIDEQSKEEKVKQAGKDKPNDKHAIKAEGKDKEMDKDNQDSQKEGSHNQFLYHEEDNLAQTFMAMHKNNLNRAFNFKFNKKAANEKKIEQQTNADTIKQSEKILNREIDALTELSETEKGHIKDETKQALNHFTLSLEIKSLLEDFQDIEIHYHLFPGDNDMEQTKIDMIFNSILYDTEYVGISLVTTYELFALGGAIALCIASYIMGLVFSELPAAYNAMIFKRQNGPLGDGWSALISAFCFSIAYACKPFVAHRMAYGLSVGTYFGINMFTQFATLMFIYIIVEVNKNVLVNQCIALLLFAASEYFFFNGNINITKSSEITNSIELMKSVLSPEMSDEQIEQIEIQLLNIKEKLGENAFNRVLLDFALTGNALSLIYASHPIIPIRSLYDKKYEGRILSWGGGYPRPICEIIEKLYEIDDEKLGSSHFKLDLSNTVSEFTNQQLEKIRANIKNKYENANKAHEPDEASKVEKPALNTILEESSELKKSDMNSIYQRISVL